MDGVSKRFSSGAVLEGTTLRLEDGQAVALLGPSGSGKTTVLRILAGLEKTDSGDVLFGGEQVTDLPPAQRNVALVFQETVLYPFLDVRANIEFPLTTKGLPETEIAARVEAEVRVLGIAELLRRRPNQLSAGQRHIVQMAKALVRNPSLLLIDEPFAGLDPTSIERMRAELRMLQRGYRVTALYATHDQEDAMALADQVAVMSQGRILQVGTPEEVYNRPADTFVATFVGSPEMSLLEGFCSSGGVNVAELTLPCPRPLRGEVLVGIRPESWTHARRGVRARVGHVTDLGPYALVEVMTGAGPARVRWRDDGPEKDLELTLRPTDYHLFDPATGRALFHS